MERGLPRTGLTGSDLIAWLSRTKLVEGPAVPPSFAQGMARWLGWTDAIALSGALHAPAPMRRGSAAAPSLRNVEPLAAVEESMARVRAALLRALDRDMPVDEADFAPYRRHIGAMQRAMEDAIGPLRVQARTSLAQGTPEIARLAAIDAVMEKVLGPHEHSLLAMMPTLLERHFVHLQNAFESPGAAVTAFRQDLRSLLLAELDLRLQPVLGLIEALRATQQG
jgi:hypothetical protein